MKLSKHAKFWALGALGGVGLFALGVFAQQNGALDIDSTNQDLFSDLKAVFFLERKDNNEIDSIVRLNVSNGTVVSAPTSDLAGGEAKNALQNNASIIGSTNSANTSSGAFLIATNSGRVEGESMQSFVWGASNTTLKGYNAIAVATKNTNLEADNTLALAAKDSTVLARDSVVLGGEKITINPAGQASLAVWSKINVLGASGALVFNGKTIPLQVDTASAHTMVVNADNGLIINTNNSNNQKIQLTVSGAIKLWEVNNAPAQASPYISVKTKGSVTCVCGKVNNQNSALSKYTRGNKQIADLCQKVCDDQNTTLTAQCGAAATNYPLTQTQWSTDDFCQWGLGHAGAKPTFPTLGGQVSWTCESFPSGGPTCTATRKGCGDGIRAAGEQCDLGTNNGKPDSNCSVSCENVKAPKCWANAKTYLGSDVAWAQPNGFCTDDSVLEEATPAFWNGSTSGQKTWTCKNKNNKNLTCSANRLPPAVAGACGTTLNTCSAGTLSGQTSITHGKRWSCDGLYGGSNKTCSTCDSGYKYNTTTNICEVDCPNPIYRHTNGVTIKAAACAESGKEYMFEGQKYYVARDKDDIKQKIATNSYPANRIVTTRVTELNNLFENNNTFNQDIWNWDTSNVTSMIYTFRQAYAFNQDINYWDVSKVRDMSWMFLVASAFNKPLNRWNTSNVENMADMFAVTYNFNQDISNWDVSKVNTMRHMFAYTTNYNKPLTNWNTSNVRNMDRMFWESKAFNQPVAHLNISNVTTMVGMFSNNPVFNQPLNGWGSKLHNNVNLTNTFRGTTAFNQPLDQWNIWIKLDSHLTTMFSGATAFKTNQPYCNWANWSAKKWNFVSMGLDLCPSYGWRTQSHGACRWKSFLTDGEHACIANDPSNKSEMARCMALGPNKCSSGCTVSQPTVEVKDINIQCFDNTNWIPAANSLCAGLEKPLTYEYCAPSQPSQKCYKEDYRTMPTSFNISTSSQKIIGSYGWISLSYLASAPGVYLDATLGMGASYLYIPINYHPIHSDSSINTLKGTLTLKWNVSKTSGWINPINKTIPIETTLITHWTTRYLKLSTKGLVQGDSRGIPCDDSSAWYSNCNIHITEAKLTLDKIEIPCSTQPTCPTGFTTSNGKCVKWKCENTPASSTPGKCEWSYSRPVWICNRKPNYRDYTSQNECLNNFTREECEDVVGVNFEVLYSNPWIESFRYPTVGDWLSAEYPYHFPSPVIYWNQKFSATYDRAQNNLSFHSPLLFSSKCYLNWHNATSCSSWGNITFQWSYSHPIDIWRISSIEPICEYQDTFMESCSSLNQTECGSKSWCTWTPWTTTPATTKAVCVDDQWNTIPERFCSNAWPKPSCTSLVNGQCKIHAWTSASQPATVTANGCIAGEYEDIPDDTTNWKWKCKGKNGGTETICSAAKGSTNPLDRKPWTVRFIVNCPDYISSIQIEWISKTPNEGPRYDDYYIDLPLVNGNGEMPTPEYPWLKRWYPVLNKTFDDSIRKITIVRDNAAPGKWWAYQINLPSNLIPQNLPEGGRYDIPTMSCLRSGEA